MEVIKSTSPSIKMSVLLTVILSVPLMAFGQEATMISSETLARAIAAKKISKTKALNLCDRALTKRIKKSVIKRNLFHISQMREPCKGILLSKYAIRVDKRGEQPEVSSYYPLTNIKSQFSSWGIDPKFQGADINLAAAWMTFKKKSNVTVAVIDTGIDPNHAFLKDNIYVKEGIKGDFNYGVDFSFKGNKSTKTPADDHGHGTHVSGIIKSVFPDVKILALKYYNPKHSGKQNLASTIRALEYAVNAGVDIINYSGGGPEPAVEELRILKEAERKGILIIAAAGNDRANIDNKFNAYYPASYGLSNIITVTAHNQNVNTLASSNWGKSSVDLSAPGYRIRSSIPLNRASFMTGTSQATAFATGVASLIKSQYPELTAQDIKLIIRSSAKKDIKLAGKCISNGKLDAGQALKTAKDYSIRINTRSVAASKK